MNLKIAALSDIDAVLRLHAKYQVDSIKEEDKKDGFSLLESLHFQGRSQRQSTLDV